MLVKFSSTFFTNNRKNLANAVNDGIIVLTAHGQVQRSGDTTYPFRQDSNFWYLTGISKPDILLVIIPGKEEFLIMPKRSKVQEIFEGVYDAAEIQKQSGIAKYYTYEEGWERLKKAARKTKHVYTVVADAPEGFYINSAKLFLATDLRRQCGNEKVRNIAELAKLRMIKQPEEINAIQKAVNVSMDAFKNIMKPGWHDIYTNEHHIHTEFYHQFLKNNAVPAYSSIVAAGVNACTLHYIENNMPIQSNDVLLIDAGAEHTMYAADITRVYKASSFTKQERSVFSAVKEANELARSMARPGNFLKDIELAVEKYFGNFLKSAGLITTKERSDIRKYYPHSISHHLGLDVHDAADYSVQLAEGMVITIEPGLYIPQWKVGIRLEDDILITKTGNKNLTTDLPYN